jgi:hypothetical protein
MHIARAVLTVRRPCVAGSLIAICLMLLLRALCGLDASAQEPAPQADPQDFGLMVPDAPHRPGNDRLVLVKSPTNELVVAKVLIEVGDHLVVMLSNGRLASVPQQEATATDRPFAPAKMADMAAELTAEKFRGFKTRMTKRYLYVYNTSEPFFQATSRILETMYPALFAYCKRQKIPVHDPETPLVAIMFRTQEEFEKYREMPEGVVAYYNGVSNYVVMYEQSSLLEIAPDLAVKQSISTIAHEGVHQILHNIGVQQRLSNWPMWISEGLPEYFAPTTVDKRVRWKGVGLPNDLRMKELETFLKQEGSDAALAEQTSKARSLSSTGYAAAWALTHTLAERRKDKFFAYLAEVSKRGPLDKFTESEDEKLFSKHFGDDFKQLDNQIAKSLQKLPYADPVANQTFYAAMLEAPLGAVVRRGYIITTSPKAIKEWQQEQLNDLPPAAQAGARFTVQAFPNKNAATSFAKGWAGN